METKPLELLRELLARAGNVVSKDELLDAIWPDVVVVEASLPTAVYKLRLALRDDGRARRIIETVSGVGYRLVVPVEVEAVLDSATPATAAQAEPARPGSADARTSRWPPKGRILKLASVFGVLAIASMAVAFPLFQPQNSSAANTTHSFSQQDAANAVRRLDIGAVERMLAAGWNPDTPFDQEGNGAVNWVLNICEWDRAHDRRRMLLMVRTLLDGGARVDRRNIWGDTPYSIAAAPRYCGPHHPVTEMIRTMCYAGINAPGDRCLATYQVARRRGRSPD
jgi:DNA-binding winged helix-turn-helix (wHTH) protein